MVKNEIKCYILYIYTKVYIYKSEIYIYNISTYTNHKDYDGSEK